MIILDVIHHLWLPDNHFCEAVLSQQLTLPSFGVKERQSLWLSFSPLSFQLFPTAGHLAVSTVYPYQHPQLSLSIPVCLSTHASRWNRTRIQASLCYIWNFPKSNLTFFFQDPLLKIRTLEALLIASFTLPLCGCLFTLKTFCSFYDTQYHCPLSVVSSPRETHSALLSRLFYYPKPLHLALGV